jgi:archaellum biogenesis ATPase FlaH
MRLLTNKNIRSLVVEKLSVKYSLDDRIGLAFFYYKHQNSAGQSSKTILATLIKQLIQRKKILPAPLKKFHGRYSSEDGLPSNAKLQAQLVEVSKTFDKVIIVIDALDEFQDQDQDPFIPLIKSLCLNLGLNIKVFVTSTREKSIEESFQALICPVVKINIERIRPDLDIADFVASEVDRRSEGYVHGVIDQKIKERIKASLVSRSCGRLVSSHK